MSDNYGIIRANDMYVPEGVEIPRYEEYAINGLYFEYSDEGYLSDYVCEMLGSPKCQILTDQMREFLEDEGIIGGIKQGTIIAVGGELYEYAYKSDNYHIAYEILMDDDGRLTATYKPFAFTDEELKDNTVNFTKAQWYGIVEHFIVQQNSELFDDEIETATEDIVGRCFAYGIPTIEELPEYIAEYLNR